MSFQSMNLQTLKALCKEKNVKGYSKLNKNDILQLLSSTISKTDENNVINIKDKIKTEDTGKIFERAICLSYGIEYDGKYKYGDEISMKLKDRLERLTLLFPKCYHTAKIIHDTILHLLTEARLCLLIQ